MDTSFVQLLVNTNPKYYWPGKNGDDMRSGASEYIIDLNVLKAKPAWSFLDGDHGIVRAAPLIDDKMNIYLTTVSDLAHNKGVGTVRKFSADGKILWNYTDTSPVPMVASLHDGAIYFTNAKGVVTALDMETGKEIWRKSALGDLSTGSSTDTWSMAAVDGIVLTAVTSLVQENPAGNDFIVALDAKTGDKKWNYRPDQTAYNVMFSIKDGSAVFSDSTGRVYRLDLETGRLIWKAGPARPGEIVLSAFNTGGTVLGPNGVAYVTSNAYADWKKSGFITAFNFSDGSMLWRTSTEYEANNAAAIGNIGGFLSLAIGVGENPDGPPDGPNRMIPDNAAFLKEKKARVIVLDAVHGSFTWVHELPAWHGWGAGEKLEHICMPDSFGNAAIGGDGTVFVGFQSGHFIGLKDKDVNGQIDEEEVASFDTGRCFQGTPAIAPGMLAATPCNGLHVFKT